MAYDNQRNQGGIGGSGGTATANPSGIKKFVSGATRNIVKLAGVDPDILGLPVSQVLTNTVNNIKDKGLVGSIAEGTKNSLGELATESTNFGKGIIQGGKAILFGRDGDVEEVSAQPQVATKSNEIIGPNTPFTTPPSNNFSGPTPGAKIGDTFLSQERDGNLNIQTSTGGIGNIKFNDGRQLDSSQLNSLAKQIEFNNSERGLASFARNAELTNAREIQATKNNELDLLKKQYYSSPSFAVRSSLGRRIAEIEGADLEREKIGANVDVASAKNEFEARKYMGDAAFKGLQESNKQESDAYKLVAEGRRAGILDPSTAAAYFKRNNQPLTFNKLGAILDQSVFNDFVSAENDNARAAILKDNGIALPQDIESIINSYRQGQ